MNNWHSLQCDEKGNVEVGAKAQRHTKATWLLSINEDFRRSTIILNVKDAEALSYWLKDFIERSRQ